jgi:hypothetical protein
VKHLLLAAVAALALSASLASCSDMFNPPELPDLKKDPYDFSVVVPPFKGDGGGGDMAGEGPHDLSMSSTTD